MQEHVDFAMGGAGMAELGAANSIAVAMPARRSSRRAPADRWHACWITVADEPTQAMTDQLHVLSEGSETLAALEALGFARLLEWRR